MDAEKTNKELIREAHARFNKLYLKDHPGIEPISNKKTRVVPKVPAPPKPPPKRNPPAVTDTLGIPTRQRQHHE